MAKFDIGDKVKWKCLHSDIWLRGTIAKVSDYNDNNYYKITIKVPDKDTDDYRWVHESNLQPRK